MKNKILNKITLIAVCIVLAVFASCKKDDSSSDSGSGNGGSTGGGSGTGGEVIIEGNNYTINGIAFTMIAVESGTFNMGAQNTDPNGTNYDPDAWQGEDSPVHQVTLNSFSIGETEVTQELWQAVMGSNPSHFSGTNLPVEMVSWNDCQEFITKLNQMTGITFRLPTEAEWEYAARGGNKSNGYKYSGSNNVDDVAWFNDSSGSKTVGMKSPNELGLYDMNGNVYEWCQDWYSDYSESSQTNPTGPNSGSDRVLRGGSWYTSSADDCRVSSRVKDEPSRKNNREGLRLAMTN